MPEGSRLRLDLCLLELFNLHHQLQRVRVEKELNRWSRRHPGVALLRTIPGVGIRTAEALVAYIEDPDRFHRKTIAHIRLEIELPSDRRQVDGRENL